MPAHARDGVGVWTREDPRYPPALRDIPRAPTRLWTRGDRTALDVAAVAVVGTRRASGYGVAMARRIARTLAQAGACVLSGLAAGVDAAAHDGALGAGGRTCAALGTGIDVVFPAAHAGLQERIAAEGLLVSQFPPGTQPFNYNFPKRNALIATLARAVIVIEAPVNSGALITVRAARSLGRTVAVVPGPIDQAAHAGSNALLREPEIVAITSAEDALALLGARLAAGDPPPDLGPDAAKVWDALAAGPADVDTLTLRAHLPATHCLAALTTLELAGLVTCDATGEVRRA
jgi:DNA processing protein